MDTAQWPQDVGGMVKAPSMEEMMAISASTTSCSPMPPPPQMMERRARPQKEQALNCPRCNSTNTKFCYYNNYSLTQPRYFCKTCRRYWTEGGSLRNVPVGGGSRKNKRSSASTTTNNSASSQVLSSTASSKKLLQDLTPPPVHNTGTGGKFHHEGHDLNLAFPQLGVGGDFGAHHYHNQFHAINSSATATCSSTASTAALATAAGTLSAMELLRGGAGISVRGMSPFMSIAPMQVDAATGGLMYPNGGFALHDFRSSGLGYTTVDHHGMGAGGGSNGAGAPGYDHNRSNPMHEVQQNEDSGGGGTGTGGAEGRVLFPFEDLRQVASSDGGTAGFDHGNRGQGGDSSGFWSRVMSGGGGSTGGAPW